MCSAPHLAQALPRGEQAVVDSRPRTTPRYEARFLRRVAAAEIIAARSWRSVAKRDCENFRKFAEMERKTRQSRDATKLPSTTSMTERERRPPRPGRGPGAAASQSKSSGAGWRPEKHRQGPMTAELGASAVMQNLLRSPDVDHLVSP